uniref:Uncharacterized protein n=1 Tax=Rhizophora mucronata TaxID=61149 RepID=A0A2P2Q5B7_RHIMU
MFSTSKDSWKKCSHDNCSSNLLCIVSLYYILIAILNLVNCTLINLFYLA